MIAKVAYLCTIMVVVQSRAVLYGTSLLESIISDGSNDENNPVLLSKESTEDPEDGGTGYGIYDLGSTFLLSIFKNSQLPASTSSLTRGITEAAIPAAAFNSVLQDESPIEESLVSAEGAFLNGLDADPFAVTGNGTFTNSRLFDISHWDRAIEVFGHGMSSFVAFGYGN